jgi:hypothetical protein
MRKNFKALLDEVSTIVDGRYTQGIGPDGATELEAFSDRLRVDDALAWLATFERHDLGNLPKKPGVYLADVKALQYVGVASNMYSRWWSQSAFVPGHLNEASGSRSRAVVDVMTSKWGGIAAAEILVRAHGSKSYERLAVEECFTYACLLRVSGESHLSWWDRRVVNSPAMLGSAKRADAVPVVAVHAESGEYAVFESLKEASRAVFNEWNGGVSMVVRGARSSTNGFSFRKASEPEIAFLGERKCVLGFTPSEESHTVVTAKAKGTFAVTWVQGPMSDAGLSQIRVNRKRTDAPQTDLIGVEWNERSGKWRAVAYRVVDGRKHQAQFGLFSTDTEAYEATLAWVAEDPVNRALATRKCAPRADRVLDGYWQPGKPVLRVAVSA